MYRGNVHVLKENAVVFSNGSVIPQVNIKNEYKTSDVDYLPVLHGQRCKMTPKSIHSSRNQIPVRPATV